MLKPYIVSYSYTEFMNELHYDARGHLVVEAASMMEAMDLATRFLNKTLPSRVGLSITVHHSITRADVE